MLPLLSLLLALGASANPVNEPALIGSISTKLHAVSGDLYAIDEKTLMVKNFNYDGAGPDAFFWVGTEGSPSNVGDESKTAILAHPFQGVHYTYRDDSAPVLKAASQETLTLILPDHMKVSDLKWMSVWCRLYSVDFGNLIFPAEFEVPGAEPEPESESEPEPEPTKKEELPSPVVISNSVEEEPKAEPESKPEAEPEPESEAEPGYNHEDEGHNPNSLESKSEPEPEPASASLASMSIILSILSAMMIASLL